MGEAKAYTSEEIAVMRRHWELNPATTLYPKNVFDKWIATVDARDAEIAHLTAERDEARAEVERVKSQRNLQQETTAAVLAERDRLLGLVRENFEKLQLAHVHFGTPCVVNACWLAKYIAKLTRELGEEMGR